MKQPFVPLPQPKKVISPKVKALTEESDKIKKKLGLKGKLNPGDLIQKSKEKKLSILGLI